MQHCVKCEKAKQSVKALIKVVGTDYICDACIGDMNAKIVNALKPKMDSEGIPSAKEMVAFLDDYIVGQDDAKQTLAVAVRNHFKRISMSEEVRKDVQKSNVLIIGNSGTGKTAMIQRLAEYVDIPMLVVDANRYTAAGYTGEDVENMIDGLYQLSGRNKQKTEMGIIFIDEIDKKRKEKAGNNKDLGGEEVQKSLLKIVEGTNIKVSPHVTIDTSNIMFIAGGAFVGLEDIIKRRTKDKSIGFFSEDIPEQLIGTTISEDLFKFGMIPELVGRFPVVTHTLDLSEDELMRITKEPKNSIYNQFKRLFEVDGLELIINDDVLRTIITNVRKDKIGVRGIAQQFNRILKDYQYNSEDYVKDGVAKLEFKLNRNNEITLKTHKRSVKIEKK